MKWQFDEQRPQGGCYNLSCGMNPSFNKQSNLLWGEI
jgi:hypothetical protein